MPTEIDDLPAESGNRFLKLQSDFLDRLSDF